MHLHFDSPPQIRAGLNMVWTALLTTVYYTVKSIVDSTVLPNSGLCRPISVTAPQRTLLNCAAPAALYARNTTCQRVADLMHGALAQAVPDRVLAACNGACFSSTFSGTDPRSGKTWIYLETHGGGSGARATKDGLDGVHVHVVNTSNLPVESLELEYPLSVLRYELVEGSGGTGKYRGGMGLRRVYRAEADCLIRLIGSRMMTVPWGLFGGNSGQPGQFLINSAPAKLRDACGELKTGDILEIITPGAGGYGPPKLRDRALVEQDFRERIIDPSVAADVYGYSG
jgi:N-methylhydantoinase B